MIVAEECASDRHETTHAINLFDMHQKYADVLPLGEVVSYLRSPTLRITQPEPNVPQDLWEALAKAPRKILDGHHTDGARGKCNNAETRTRRVEVSLSKMNSGKRRPCCFDRSACTDPKLARNGRLREPA
jgi:hypothetical protein